MRAVRRHGALLRLTVDGNTVEAVEGDSLLAVLLLNGKAVRHLEFGGAPRAGFCLMGACQDCWVLLGNGERVRACTTLAANGMVIWTDRHEAKANA
ncbi:(2Fe-2S)-binding protein [Microvirga guangxiensis]|uniref:2Fe-2S iron-sulfur cluster binding domain-containing protein n=1 Tax=Microvirga guangxiensis TaxID=549386 RepID=A0A1G5BLH7_9HYPH|nr:(2Fe-2S)-binding protein [Microvirga guangxiensis]SCX90954.1 2Fe-2S iron-sulfur cluster binding domain-containing protein [Microvirga guangxiensis]